MTFPGRSRLIVRAVPIVLAIALASVPVAGRAQQRPAVRIAVAAVETAAAVYYAQDLGYFDRAGLDVTISHLDNGAAISAAVLSGSIDVGFANPTSLEIAHTKNLPLTIIARAGIYEAAHPSIGLIVVANGSPLRTGKDLAGKTVAVPGLGIITDLSARSWIDKNGGDSTLSHYAEMPIALMPQSIVSGRVDAAIMDAATSEGQDRASLHVIGSTMDAIAPKFYASVWFTSADWIAKYPDAVKKVAAIIRDASGWANAHPREAVALFVKHSSFTQADLLAVDRPTFATTLAPELLQPSIEAAARYGVIKESFPAKDLLFAFPR
jgi:NitT/TauT family transport system substrate-binding protein